MRFCCSLLFPVALSVLWSMPCSAQSSESPQSDKSFAQNVREQMTLRKPKETALSQSTQREPLEDRAPAARAKAISTSATSASSTELATPKKAPKLQITSSESRSAPQSIPKISTIFYDEQTAQEPILVFAKRGFVVQIQFAPTEKIEKCAGGSIDCLITGDYNGWFISGRAGDRSIFVKPNSSAFPTNLNIITNFYSYSFDLQVLSDKTKSEGNWRIAFTHPQNNSADPRYEEGVLQDRLSSKQPYRRNTRYTMQKIEGSDEILPSATWDDGVHTYIRISNNRSKPAIFKVLGDNSEQTVNSHMEGDVIVVHETAKRWVMRLGSAVVGIWNDAFDPDGVPPVDGTTVPGVVRSVKPGVT